VIGDVFPGGKIGCPANSKALFAFARHIGAGVGRQANANSQIFNG
jgi:hypothetical protein